MKILKTVNPENILFLDIETVRAEKELTENSKLFEAWKYKNRYNSESYKLEGSNITIEELFNTKAALYAPFGKIVCITIGKIIENGTKIKLFSIYDEDEHKLLSTFNKTINGLYLKNKDLLYCGYNSKQYDLPFIQKRMIVNNIEYHDSLDKGNLKPWEIKDIDLAELWKGCSFYQDSLISLTSVLDIESPKNDINGSETSDVYWEDSEKGILKIVEYCEKDVVATINIFRRFRFEPIILEVEGIKYNN